jgi:type IV secretion system protein VirB10
MENSIEQQAEESSGIPLMGAKGKPPEEKKEKKAEKKPAVVMGEVKATTKDKSNINGLMKLGFVVGGIFILSASLIFYQKWKKSHAPANAPVAAVDLPIFSKKNSAVESDDIEAKKREIEKEEAMRKLEEQEAERKRKLSMTSAQTPVSSGSGSGSYGGGGSGSGSGAACPDGKCPSTPDERKLAGEVLVYGYNAPNVASSDSAPSGNSNNGLPANYPKPPSMPFLPEPKEPENSIAKQLKATVLKAGSAGHLSNLDYLLKRGTIIPCSLTTGIDTTLAGFIICKVTNDVYSANGKTMLINKGAMIHGEQQSSLTNGQARVFILWTRIDNDDGVFAELDSPGTDAMGYNGVGGFVDTHFGDRFGAAMLISVLNDASQFALSNLAQNPNVVTPNQTIQTGNAMAQEVLKRTVDVPPTLTVLPATRVNVLVSRDVSFESVYKVIE